MYGIEGYCMNPRGMAKRWISTTEESSADALATASRLAIMATDQGLHGAVFVRGGGEWIAQYSYGRCPSWLQHCMALVHDDEE